MKDNLEAELLRHPANQTPGAEQQQNHQSPYCRRQGKGQIDQTVQQSFTGKTVTDQYPGDHCAEQYIYNCSDNRQFQR
ncbi:hypothetical protein D3C75_1033150 [compost metagenome]